MKAWVMNFANSIVGVGILAVPFCFNVCGIGMAILMILATNVLTRKTCEYLLKAGHLTRKTGYESLAQHHLGAIGKLVTELGIIGLMLGTLISFQVVIGDLSPALINSVLGVEQTWSLRTFLMCLSSLGVIPLALMRNISSLANMNAMSMGFYCIFVFVVIFMSLKNLTSELWSLHVNFWRPEGFFHCLPIISLSFSCQSQVLIMYEAIPEQSPNIMMDIINKAIHLVTVMYMAVGFFGYVAFYESGIRGDILANFSSGLLADTIKAGFWISIVISFPLIIFPLRLSIHSLLFTNEKKGEQVVSSAADYIPQDRFTIITVCIVLGTLTIGILVPHIETVLSITGAVVGTFLCFVFPSALYILTVSKEHSSKATAKVIFIISVICMVASTLAVLSANDTHASAEHQEHPGHEKSTYIAKPIKPFQLPGEPITRKNIITDGGNNGIGGASDGGRRIIEGDGKPNANFVEDKRNSENGNGDGEKLMENINEEKRIGEGKPVTKRKTAKTSMLRNDEVPAGNIEAFKVKDGNVAKKAVTTQAPVDLANRKMALPSVTVPAEASKSKQDLKREKKDVENEKGINEVSEENGNRIKSREIMTLLKNGKSAIQPSSDVRRADNNASALISMDRNKTVANRKNSTKKEISVTSQEQRNNV